MQPVIPAYVAPVVLVVMLGLAAYVARAVARAAAVAPLPDTSRRRVVIVATLILGAWLLAAILRAPSTAPLDASGRGVVPIAFAVFGVASLVVALGALALSDAWRRTLDAIPVERLVLIQAFRMLGVIFVQLWTIGALPKRFALGAGLGDIAIGLAAPFVAFALARHLSGSRALALTWNTLGVLDLVAAVGLGTGFLVHLMAPASPLEPAAAMTMFPLAIVPTFGVPLAIVLHLYTYRALARSTSVSRGDRVPLSPRTATVG